MLLFRSLSVGLLGACVCLLAQRPFERVRVEHERELVAVRPAPAPTIIDVAPGLTATQIAELVHLAPDERVTSVDDRPVTGNLDAGTVIEPHDRHFVDLTVASSAGERRVLVLIH
ncbi:MAG TPA: hypothetical protein VFQ65_09595 [Kofleriaceae bacterium]|nr:hypothetical protein [Kofleriaceae bacterium]